MKSPTLRMALLAVVTLGAAGCATVKQDQFDREMAQLRAEISEGDATVSRELRALEGRVDDLDARMNALSRALTDLETEMDVTVQRFEASLRFVTPVHFAFDDAAVDDEGRRILARFTAVLNDVYPGALVTVEGFTDPAGSESYNLRLGQRRADAVRDILVDGQGLEDAQVRAVSYGEDTRRLVDPGASGPGAPGSVNRRVALVVEHPGRPLRTTTEDGA